MIGETCLYAIRTKTREAGAMDEWERLRAAFDRVKDFPEFKPEERVYWLELRSAVEKLLERHS